MDLLNPPHLHLLLNHFPTVGMVVGVGLLLLALVRRNDHLQRASFEVLFVIALVTLPAYITGVAAQAPLRDVPEVSQAAIDAHHDAALMGFVGMQVTGVAAWFALWDRRRRTGPGGFAPAAVLLTAILTLALMGNAANIGGEIRHPEIKIDRAAIAARGLLNVSAVQAFVSDTPWVWPALETLHFLGLSLLFGILAFANLRILGAMKGVPFGAIHRLLPWAVMAYGINLVTGMLFFINASEQYVNSVPFYWKIGVLLPAGANVLYLTVSDRIWSLEAEQDAPVFDKAVAASGIVLWVAVMYFGRMLPFLGTSF